MSLRDWAEAIEPLWRKPRPTRGAAIHDYTVFKGPGHDYVFSPIDGGLRASAQGWGRGIKRGDFLLLRNAENYDGKAQYRVDEIKYYSDPSDMWSAQLTFVPRTAPSLSQPTGNPT